MILHLYNNDLSELDSDIKNLIKSKDYSITTNINGIGSATLEGYCIGFQNNQGIDKLLVVVIVNHVTYCGSAPSNLKIAISLFAGKSTVILAR